MCLMERQPLGACEAHAYSVGWVHEEGEVWPGLLPAAHEHACAGTCAHAQISELEGVRGEREDARQQLAHAQRQLAAHRDQARTPFHNSLDCSLDAAQAVSWCTRSLGTAAALLTIRMEMGEYEMTLRSTQPPPLPDHGCDVVQACAACMRAQVAVLERGSHEQGTRAAQLAGELAERDARIKQLAGTLAVMQREAEAAAEDARNLRERLARTEAFAEERIAAEARLQSQAGQLQASLEVGLPELLSACSVVLLHLLQLRMPYAVALISFLGVGFLYRKNLVRVVEGRWCCCCRHCIFDLGLHGGQGAERMLWLLILILPRRSARRWRRRRRSTRRQCGRRARRRSARASWRPTATPRRAPWRRRRPRCRRGSACHALLKIPYLAPGDRRWGLCKGALRRCTACILCMLMCWSSMM